VVKVQINNRTPTLHFSPIVEEPPTEPVPLDHAGFFLTTGRLQSPTPLLALLVIHSSLITCLCPTEQLALRDKKDSTIHDPNI
jgi:hypothetical protein